MSRRLDAERDALRKKIANARRKVKRLEGKGVTDLGRYNPIRDDAPINRYTRRQLEKYERELDAFTSRSTRYVPDAHGRAIPQDIFNRYARLAEQRRVQADKFFRQIEDYTLPSRGATVKQTTAFTEPDHPELYNPSANPVRKLAPKKPQNFNNAKAVEKYIKSLDKQTAAGYLQTVRKQGMPLITDALKDSRQGKELLRAIRKLTDEQFGVLWTVKSYVDAVSQYYELEKALHSDQDLPFSEDAMRAMQANALSEIKAMVSDAQGFTPNQPNKMGNARKSARKRN